MCGLIAEAHLFIIINRIIFNPGNEMRTFLELHNFIHLEKVVLLSVKCFFNFGIDDLKERTHLPKLHSNQQFPTIPFSVLMASYQSIDTTFYGGFNWRGYFE